MRARWVVLVVATNVVTVVLGALLAAPSATSRTSALPRATENRPDDVQGPQVHVLYVVPRDGVDRGLDTNGVVAASVESWQRWLRGQTGGRGLRLDTFQGEPRRAGALPPG